MSERSSTGDASAPATDDRRLELRTVGELAGIDAQAWQGLEGAEHPFLSWHFLSGLERTGCVAPERGWLPLHLTAWRGDTLVAAAPAYVKGDGMGDFSRDWATYDALRQLGGRPYPKLVMGVPFSPVTGRRILVRPGFDRTLATRVIVELALEVARSSDLGSIQVLYHEEDEVTALREAGLAHRALVQYHWSNYDYESPQDWLSRLPGRKRKQVRRERREPQRQGIEIRTWRHEDRRQADGALGDPEAAADLAFELYRTTCEKYMWGGTYLNREFFGLLFADPRLAPSVELVAASRAGAPAPEGIVAGAINLASPTHLYGRYWGCHEEHRFLHFNVCLYHSIDRCIERGLRVFEGGAGGEHKVSRGFEPTLVHHSLWFAGEAVHEALAEALERDARRHREGVLRWHRDKGLDRPDHPAT